MAVPPRRGSSVAERGDEGAEIAFGGANANMSPPASASSRSPSDPASRALSRDQYSKLLTDDLECVPLSAGVAVFGLAPTDGCPLTVLVFGHQR